jgi:hypothetical protein
MPNDHQSLDPIQVGERSEKNGGPCHDLVNGTTSSSNELLQDTFKSPRINTDLKSFMYV